MMDPTIFRTYALPGTASSVPEASRVVRVVPAAPYFQRVIFGRTSQTQLEISQSSTVGAFIARPAEAEAIVVARNQSLWGRSALATATVSASSVAISAPIPLCNAPLEAATFRTYFPDPITSDAVRIAPARPYPQAVVVAAIAAPDTRSSWFVVGADSTELRDVGRLRTAWSVQTLAGPAPPNPAEIVAAGRAVFLLDQDAITAAERRGHVFILAPGQPMFAASAQILDATPALTVLPGILSVHVAPIDTCLSRGPTGVPGTWGIE